MKKTGDRSFWKGIQIVDVDKCNKKSNIPLTRYSEYRNQPNISLSEKQKIKHINEEVPKCFSMLTSSIEGLWNKVLFLGSLWTHAASTFKGISLSDSALSSDDLKTPCTISMYILPSVITILFFLQRKNSVLNGSD